MAQFTAEKIEDITILTLPGDAMDAANSQEIKRDIAPNFTPGAKVVLDLSRLRFVDSTGVGTILSSLRRLKEEGGALALCGVQRPVRLLFDLVRLDKMVSICGTREEAIAHLQGAHSGRGSVAPSGSVPVT